MLWGYLTGEYISQIIKKSQILLGGRLVIMLPGNIQ